MSEKKYCCAGLGYAINQGLIVEKNNEFLLVPADPTANKTLALSFCPFCRAPLTNIISEGCEKSPDKKHCWHLVNPTTVFLPGGTNEMKEFCCWCGQNRQYTIEVTTSVYSSNTRTHGPNYKEVLC